MSNEKLGELTRHLEELRRRQTEDKLGRYVPYAKQKEFHTLGASKRERMLLAGNQQGKTFCGGMEMAIHLTGRYPDWWQGRRFETPIRAWAAGNTGESTRDTVQRILIGPLGHYGSGTIPKDAVIDTRTGRGVPDALDTILVRHANGGTSQVSFKSYERGRERWQGETLHAVWYDEEPPVDVYTEGLARISATRGIAYLTATPLLGMTGVVRRFLQDPSADRGCVKMTINDAEHISVEEREKIISGYPEHEREARVNGVPMLGSGRVFPIAESAITEDAFELPQHFARIVGLDFGINHPTAAAWLAWDRDTDTVHVHDCYRVRGESAIVHAAAIRARGAWIPCAWPHDGHSADKGSGDSLASIYRAQGVHMISSHATFEDGGNSVEAGIQEMLIRMQTGRLKVARHLLDWFEEFRLYHRKDGRIVKEADDLLSATRYGLMMLRHARTAEQSGRRRGAQVARDVDYSIFGGDGTNDRPRARIARDADWSPFS